LLLNSVIGERLIADIAAFLLVRLKRLLNETMESVARSVPQSLSSNSPGLPNEFPSCPLSFLGGNRVAKVIATSPTLCACAWPVSCHA
jgi:hypothetical protein